MMNVFCVPFAGGSKYSFHHFQRNAPSKIKVIPLELSGRGARAKEGLLENIDQMVEDLHYQIKDHLDTPYVLYGHSMGAILSALLVKQNQINQLPDPLALFVSGYGAPSTKHNKYRHLLPRNEFLMELRKMGGVPEEVLQDKEMMDYLEPILRADFKSIETYQHEKLNILNVDIFVYYGSEEGITERDAKRWQEETTGNVKIKEFDGDHFFIFEHSGEITQLITDNGIELLNKRSFTMKN